VLNNARLLLEGSSTFAGEGLVLNSTASPALENISAENWWSGPVLMNRDSIIGTRAASSLHLDGIISGTANFTKVGPGTLSFGGVNNNTYNGQTFINEGTLLLSKPLAVTAVPGVLNIGSTAGLPATVANLTSYQVVGNIIVNRGGLLNVLDQVENVDHLTLKEGGDVQTTTGVLSLKTGGSIQVLPGAVNDPSTISGNLEILAGAHSINVSASSGPATAPELDVTALVTSSGGPITMQKTGLGKMRLGADNTYSGSVIVGAGNLQLDGSQPASGVLLVGDARLIGNGRVGPVALLSPSAVVAPGASPGRLQVGDFNLYGMSGGILNIELNGTVAGSQYDQLSVEGIVDLNTLTLQAVVNFAPTTGAEFMIINNDLTDPVEGAFNGLLQDATVTLGDHIFQIDYAGGDGNDVVLTKIGEVYRPVLTIQRAGLNSVRLLWPTNDPAFFLQSTTNLAGANPGWSSVPEIPALAGVNYVVTNSTLGMQRLYRLFKP
jgi:autotransporter-associated beta strand protein